MSKLAGSQHFVKEHSAKTKPGTPRDSNRSPSGENQPIIEFADVLHPQSVDTRHDPSGFQTLQALAGLQLGWGQ